MGRLRMMVAASADAVCSVSQNMFLRGLNIVRYLPVVTLNSFWGFLLCIYRDGLVVEFFEVLVWVIPRLLLVDTCGVFVLVGGF